MYYNNANTTTQNNQNTEQNTEHQNTEEVRKMEHINNQNTNSEEIKNNADLIAAVIKTALKPRSSLPSKFCGLEQLEKTLEAIRKDEGDVFLLYEATEHRLYEARLKIARALIKNIDIALYCGNNPYILAALLKHNTSKIMEGIEEGKKSKKTTSKALVDNHTLDYALSLVNGTVSRAKGTAESLKQTALWLAHYKDAANPMEYTAVDSALNKVFAAVRRQAKKNAVEISAKSNKVTKDAVKLAVMERIREMQANHEYEFEVLIGEA